MRSKVEIVQIRVCDIKGGDVVNKTGGMKDGWLEVDRVERLPSGDLIIYDVADTDSFTAVDYDLVWLQTLVEFDTNSHLAIPKGSADVYS